MHLQTRSSRAPNNERALRPRELLQTLRPVEWSLTGQDLNRVLAEIADREPQLQLTGLTITTSGHV